MTYLQAAPSTVASFIESDYRRGLFPLATVALIAKAGASRLHEFVVGSIFDPKGPQESFRECPVDYSLKDPIHLRKALILDPLASYYLYAFVLTNKRCFELEWNAKRQLYGHGFRAGKPVDSFEEFHKLRERKYKLLDRYRHSAHVDIANCFNSFYHHDIATSIEEVLGQEEGQRVGRFLREINAGESINCFPQGYYPAKVIGSWFLRFIEGSAELKSAVIARYMDDILLCDNRPSVVRDDLHRLQVLLGSHSLCLNPEKTIVGESSIAFAERQVDDIKRRLLRLREEVAGYDDFDGEEAEELDEEDLEYIREKLADRSVAEEDVELALKLVRDDTDIQLRLVSVILGQFPHLMKALHRGLADTDCCVT